MCTALHLSVIQWLIALCMQEVEFFAQHGQYDITFGVPFLPFHLQRLVALKQQCPDTNVRIVLDSSAALALVNKALDDNVEACSAICPISVFLKVDCGYHRAGVDPQADPDGALQLAKAISSGPYTELFGLYAHSGNAYNTGSGSIGANSIAGQESACISAFASRFSGEHAQLHGSAVPSRGSH